MSANLDVATAPVASPVSQEGSSVDNICSSASTTGSVPPMGSSMDSASPQVDEGGSNPESLNTSVNSTMRLSHIIEQQQKNLIAKRVHGANENSRTSFIVLEKMGDKSASKDESEEDDVDEDVEGDESSNRDLESSLSKPNSASLINITVTEPQEASTIGSSLSESSSSRISDITSNGRISLASSLKRLINDVDEEDANGLEGATIQLTVVSTFATMSSDEAGEGDVKNNGDFNMLSRPNSAKRLKRNNVPNPLDFSTFNEQLSEDGAADSNGRLRLDPGIQSAPIRVTSFAQTAGRPANGGSENLHPSSHNHRAQQQQPINERPHPNAYQGRRIQYAAPYGMYQMYTPVHGRPIRAPYPVAFNAPMVYPPTQFSAVYPYGQPIQPIPALPQRIPAPPIRRARMPHPHTTTATHFPRHITVDSRRPPQLNGPTTGLSAAAAKDDAPSGAEATTPKTSRSKTVTDVFVGDLEKAAPLQSQPLSAQKEYFWLTRNAALANGSSPYKRTSREGDELTESEISEMQDKYRSAALNGDASSSRNEVFGSINLMNEKVFNFRIFGNGDSSTGESEAPSTSLEDRERDWLKKEKQKFLKICETSWDEYVVSRN